MHAHLESQEAEIRSRIRVSWTDQLSAAILAAKNKLTKYYSATAGSPEIFFSVEVLLNRNPGTMKKQVQLQVS